LANPHLYRVMFGPLRFAARSPDPSGDLTAAHAFLSLLRRIERCVEADRWTVDDLWTAGEVVWASVHGLCSIELTGYYDALGRDAVKSYESCLVRLAVGFHDDEERARASMASAKRRRRRTVAA
jgi:hypothetical protein